MKRTTILTLVASLLVITGLACGGTATPAATPDTQATVDTAVAATGTAQANAQATIDSAVQATSAAIPTPTPSTEYVEMTEEELAELINEAVVEATTATEEAATATTEATADDTVTQEEVQTVEVYVMDVEEAIAYAEELIYAYYALYGELATETIVLLQAIEEDLDALAEEAAAIDVALQEIYTVLDQGLALAEETITQLETAAQAAATQAEEIQERNQAWAESLQAEIESRVDTVMAIQPSSIASDRKGAVLSAFEYIDAVREGLADDKVSQVELANIAQLGANASASLSAHGGPQLQRLPSSINSITGQIASGQMPQAKANLGALESALGTRPPRPSSP